MSLPAGSSPEISGDARVTQRDGAGAAFGHAGVVGDDEDGGVEPLVEVADELEDFGAGVGVEIAGGSFSGGLLNSGPIRSDIAFPEGGQPLEVRRAGLDLDLNYLPWLGVVVRFAYE